MNWVGGARNRIKLKHEKKIQKEFFERKRHSKKVLRANQGDRQENEGKTGISQDLIALQAIVSAHDKPKRKPREVRRPHAIDLDEAKRKEHPRRKYCVELPESPGHHKPSTLDLCTGIPESSHAQKKHQNSSQSWTKHDIRENILKHEAFYNLQKRPLLTPKDTLPIQTWTNPPVKETPCYKPLPVIKEQPKPYASSFDQNPSVVREFPNLSWNQKQQGTKTFQDESFMQKRDSGDFYHTPIKQRRTMEGKCLCFDDTKFPKASKDGDSQESNFKPRALPFVPFSEPGPLSKFNIIRPKDPQELENKKIDDVTFKSVSSGTTQLSSTCTKTSDSYAESKPTALETPVQTWTARKPNIDRKDSHWSHFQIQPGQPPKKNPFFDKEPQMEDKPSNSESKESDTLSSNIQHEEKNVEMIGGKTQATKWNPFNLSYPVKIESGGGKGDDSLGCGQETAWRTFLKGSNRLSNERLQSSAPNQHKGDISNLGVSTEKEEAPKKILSPEQGARNPKIINDSFTPESEVRESLHHEALKEVMDLERDDQSSEMTSSWSSTFTDETEGNRLEAFDEHETNKVIASKNSALESDSIEKWQSMESVSSTIKLLASPQLEGVTINIYSKEKIRDKKSKEQPLGRGLNQITESPSAFLKCTESIEFFNETEDGKADSKQDLGHEGCNERYPGRVESEDREAGGLCHVKKEIQVSEKRLEKRLESPEQVQNMGQEKGTQTHIDLKVTKQRETEAKTTEQGTQTESDTFYSTSGRDAKSTQRKNNKWLESTEQGRATAEKKKLSRTGNEVETTPILKLAACPCGSDVNRNPPELFAAKQLKQGSDEKKAKETGKRTVQLSCSQQVIPVTLQKDSMLDSDDILSNQKNINWYLSMLINVLTCESNCYS